jgi:drug/metabolite transporter (DMT)-like permease
MLAAATPLLSTFLLALCLRKLPGPELMLAALLISGGILLSVRK